MARSRAETYCAARSRVSSDSIARAFARSPDAALLAAFGERTFVQSYAADNDPANMAAYVAANFNEAALARELADPRAHFFLVTAALPVAS